METGITLRIVLLAALSIIVVEAAAILAVRTGGMDPLVVLGMARCADIILVVLILAAAGPGLRAVGCSRDTLLFGLKRGLAWSAFFTGLAITAWGALILVGFDPLPRLRMTLPLTAGGLFGAVLVAGCIGPLAEELFFRGLLFGFLRSRGFWTALTVSSLLFAAAHSLTMGFPLVQLMGGIVLAALYEREKSLVTPIVVHSAGNLILLGISWWF